MIDGGDMAAIVIAVVPLRQSLWVSVPYPLPAYNIHKSASGKQSKTDLIYCLAENRDFVFYETTGERTQ